MGAYFKVFLLSIAETAEIVLFSETIFESNRQRIRKTLAMAGAFLVGLFCCSFFDGAAYFGISLALKGVLFCGLYANGTVKNLLLLVFSALYTGVFYLPVSFALKVFFHPETTYSRIAISDSEIEAVIAECILLAMLLFLKKKRSKRFIDLLYISNTDLIITCLCGLAGSSLVPFLTALRRMGFMGPVQTGIADFVFTIVEMAFYIFGIMLLFFKYTGAIRRQESVQKEAMLDALRGYYDRIYESDREIRRIRHDIKDHLAVVNEQLESGHIDKAKALIEQITGKVDMTEHPIEVGNVVVSAVFNRKLQEARSKNIDFYVNGSVSDNLRVDNYDLCTIFSNLLNNAIEAIERTNPVVRIIDTAVYIRGNSLIISVKNTFGGGAPDVAHTAKEDKRNHGFGIENVKRTVQKYQGEMEQNIDGDNFVTDILIENIKA